MLKAVGNTSSVRARTGSPDVFDVPSEDESVTRPIKPAKKLPSKHRTPKEDFDIPLSEDEAPATTKRPVKVMPPSRKRESAKTAASAPKRLQKPAQPPKPVPVSQSSSNPLNAPRSQRGKTPQPTQKATKDIRDDELVQQPEVVGKPISRAATPALSVPKASKNVRAISIPPSRKALSKRPAKASDSLEIFDMPFSDDETPVPKPKPSRQAPADTTKKTRPAAVSLNKESGESDDSNASKKRKRQGSVSSVSTAKPTIERKQELSLPQRSRKYQKKADDVSPRHQSPAQITTASTLETQPLTSTINKPRRTRVRTVPLLTRPAVAKGQSSPATLNSMIPGRQLAKPSPVTEAPEVTALEDATMYEILDPSATPVRIPKTKTSGSVTPRQKALFSSLLGESPIGTTPMPKISTLQLNDPKSTSLLGALSRSKSDLTYSAQSRKTRLIDTIKRADTSSDEDEDEDEDDDSGSEQDLKGRSASGLMGKKSQATRPAAIPSDDMDIDTELVADSQTSHATSSFGQRQRLTYAKTRSYLQETNPEDALLISMDLDDNLGFEGDNMGDEEEDLSSQVRARHELKRRGQQTAFQWETETSIDDISSKSSNAVRRNAMMELCTKMANDSFTSQLLDSSLAHQFFKNISSNDEIVFDFTTAVAFIFILKTNPTSTVLDQICGSGIIATLVKLASNTIDIRRIAKDRKTNLSKIAQEFVEKFRTLVQDCPIWISPKPEKVSPQLVALKALESLVVDMRSAGSTVLLIDQDDISQLIDAALHPAERLKSGTGSSQDILVLDLIISILEAVSSAKQKQPTWPTGTLQRLADLLPVFFQPDMTTSTMLAVKLCLNLTNNKPKACQPFSGPRFVQPLVSSITRKFGLLDTRNKLEQRTEVLETLILSLGAMINLAEFNDQARVNVDDGAEAIGTLAKVFLDGSERAAQADSMEESHSGVAVGYLTVLLGNLCLNAPMRTKIRAQLPHQQLDILIDKIKEFVRFHEHVDRKAGRFEGEEGQETWQNYTARLMLVVEKLQKEKA